jgi:hypothetical protein
MFENHANGQDKEAFEDLMRGYGKGTDMFYESPIL